MNLPEEKSKHRLWILLAINASTLAMAAAVAAGSQKPLAMNSVLWIIGLTIFGGLVGFVGVILHYQTKENEAFDERQRSLEALARTVTTSAEQISIAADGLHKIAELA